MIQLDRMSSNIFHRAIEFQHPGTIPCLVSERLDLSWLQDQDPEKISRLRELQALFPHDFIELGDCWTDSPINRRIGRGRWFDEWGVEWINEGCGSKVIGHPLQYGYDSLKDFSFPDPNRTDRFQEAESLLKQREERYCRGRVWFTLFERLWMLRGFSDLLMDPYTEPEGFSHLRDRILEINLQMIDLWLERGVDAVYFSDDWGSQRSLLINPEDWRRLYKPAYGTMFRKARDGGAHVWMHLCGNISEILPDLVDLGLNVLNPVQPQALDVYALSRDFGGRICFNGGIDVQATMVRGKPEDVKKEVHTMVHLFGRFDGGYIGGMSHSIMPETPLDNIIAVYEAFAEYL
ncbi:MAG TPA: uroporphyrinogen decarboxylase family protein [Spirochaetia bacterium]|nr:uroporphyrinogen decarboxylase family protein [Spirochaetia bacterium]